MLNCLYLLATSCANVAVPEATEEAMRFYHSGNLLWIVQQLWSLAIPLLILATGFSGKLATFSARTGRSVWFFTIAIYLLLYTAISQLLSFPLDFYAGYIRMHEYGLSSQNLSRWFSNYGKGTLVVAVLSLAFVWIFYLLLKKSPRRWWIYSSIASTAIVFLIMLIQPIWIDPLFNHFGPMKNKALEQKILDLACKAGIQGGRVFEVDKSQDTKMVNAYVIGLGSTNRIVLWDTTIAQLPEDQLLFVMGHEMGHYVLHHIWWNLIYFAALSFLLFYLTYRSAHFLLRRYGRRFGVYHLHDIGSFPLLLLLLSVFSLLTDPVSNSVSRYMEHEADRFGLEITQNNRAAGEAFVTLQEKNLANPRPGPLYKFWRCSHPPLAERVEFCNTYCPWRENRPLKYEKHFRD